MIYVATTGCAWMDMPEQYGSKSTVHKRFQDMQEKGIMEMLLKSIIRLVYRQKKFNVKKIAIDSTTIPGKKGGEKIGYDGNKKILGTKINVIVASNGLPLSMMLERANKHDSTKFIDTMEHILDFLTRDSLKQINYCFADKGYISKTIREYMEKRNIQVHIPVRKNSIARRPKKRKSKIKSVRFVVEQFFGWLKGRYRGIATRYARNSDNYLGFVYLATILIYWRVLG